MENLGYSDDSFDAVVCVFAISFVPDMVKQVRELWRMVRPGGQLAITTWGPRMFEPGSAASSHLRLGLRFRPGAIVSKRPKAATRRAGPAAPFRGQPPGACEA